MTPTRTNLTANPEASPSATSSRKACEGAATRDCRMGPEHAQQCLACGTKVRDDMVDHGFFGFRAGCSHRSAGTPGVA